MCVLNQRTERNLEIKQQGNNIFQQDTVEITSDLLNSRSQIVSKIQKLKIKLTNETSIKKRELLCKQIVEEEINFELNKVQFAIAFKDLRAQNAKFQTYLSQNN